MSDRELRDVLHAVMDDIDAGRLRRPGIRPRLWRLVAPPLLATSLGLAGCGDTAVGTSQDGTVSVDGQMDAGPVLEYMAPFDAAVEDGGVVPPYMGPFDAAVDAGPNLEYMAPFDGGAEPDYAAPEVDASVEDAGFTPLYMGPPPIR